MKLKVIVKIDRLCLHEISTNKFNSRNELEFVLILYSV